MVNSLIGTAVASVYPDVVLCVPASLSLAEQQKHGRGIREERPLDHWTYFIFVRKWFCVLHGKVS